jgi:hypothetical protein
MVCIEVAALSLNVPTNRPDPFVWPMGGQQEIVSKKCYSRGKKGFFIEKIFTSWSSSQTFAVLNAL